MKNGRGEQARVLIVGDGFNPKTARKVKLDVRGGDVIVFNSFYRCPLVIRGVEYVALREQDVLAVVTP